MMRSWIDVADGSDFPLANLPYGAFRRTGETAPRIGVAIGSRIVDLRLLAQSGLLRDALPQAVDVFSQRTLNAFLSLGYPAWHATRARLTELLSAGNGELMDAGIAELALVSQDSASLAMPIEVRDFVDFSSSLEHATNLGKMLRPGMEPLTPNWRWLPLGYQGRAANVVLSGTPVVRPRGQTKSGEAAEPRYGPTRMLDFEAELGFVSGEGPAPGASIAPDEAERHIFGAVLLNDWSARDIQAWEHEPLGPFLSTSFATSISPWVVPLEALAPFRVPGPVQSPPPLAYLAVRGERAFDIELCVTLASAEMAVRGVPGLRIARPNARRLYWSMAQQLANVMCSGARVRAGDLFGTGTISGAGLESYGSMIELTWRGARPLELPDRSHRAFLEDGDTLVFGGRCMREGATPIGFGEVRGTILPSS